MWRSDVLIVDDVVAGLRLAVERLHRAYAADIEGDVARYIPELARVDPNQFGIAVTTVTGEQVAVGDADNPLTIQSCSKPFVFAMALQSRGREAVLQKIGVEPAGDPFNTIKLDRYGRPPNPLINAGAIAAASMVPGQTLGERIEAVRQSIGLFAGSVPDVDIAVYESERATGHRNRAIAELLIDAGIFDPPPNIVLDTYFQQCSLLTSARQLSVMGATLAHGGVNPLTGLRAIDASYLRDVLTVMLTCGMYDWAGQWAYEVGVPAKSGVGGGIVAVVPGIGGIGVFSPRLDRQGNSIRGLQVCRDLARLFNFHILGETVARVTGGAR